MGDLILSCRSIPTSVYSRRSACHLHPAFLIAGDEDTCCSVTVISLLENTGLQKSR
jgi:hypothetical protein